MTQSAPAAAPPTAATPTAAEITACISATIVGFVAPFFLAGAKGSEPVAAAAIRELIDAHHPGTPTEFDLVGRIVGFSIAAMDNLRLSMATGLSNARVLRYRGNAVTLCRSSDTARKMLDALKAGQEVTRDVPRPSIAAAPPAPKLVPPNPVPPNPVSPVNATAAVKVPCARPFEFPGDIEAMKRDARTLMAAFSRDGAPGSVSPQIPDTATMVRTAVRAAVAASMRPPAA
jgi:hypothetical protein